jgi:enoyl-CoA hydratase
LRGGADIDATVEGWISALLEAGPQAIRLQKALIRRWEDVPLRQAIAAGIDTFAKAYESDEPAEMFAKFRNAHRARKRRTPER